MRLPPFREAGVNAGRRSPDAAGGQVPFQILCLSGGGYMGLYTASVLARIEKQTGRRIADSFDLIAGTSVGGIIALGLSMGRTAGEIEQAFIDDGDKIFPAKRPPVGWLRSSLQVLAGVACSRHDPAPLRAVIEKIVGIDAKMSGLLTPTVVTAVNLTKGKPRVFKTGHHRDYTRDWTLDVADVALATSAAPTYFPIHCIDDELYADGGMFANSPDMVALHEAEHFLKKDRSEIRILSVGTTTAAFAFSASTKLRLGSWGWMQDQRLPTVMIGSQQAMTNDMLSHMLPGAYLRIDHEQSPDQRRELALNCASYQAQKNLRAAATASAQEASKSSLLRTMLEHKAPRFDFINASLPRSTTAIG
ncbi:CBASS cGAMP-activated phospholipase [Methylobacterium bullatum]|uniref:CBASS cGAMP-activated phospholipase n=1 Tax=Methylobacterium bullatum TaxID=570505 RepID=UPI002467FAA3|nr:CBASS cGAMP-activated phospholipase [Methylobacterium bullatum]